MLQGERENGQELSLMFQVSSSFARLEMSLALNIIRLNKYILENMHQIRNCFQRIYEIKCTWYQETRFLPHANLGIIQEFRTKLCTFFYCSKLQIRINDSMNTLSQSRKHKILNLPRGQSLIILNLKLMVKDYIKYHQ